MSIKNIVIIMIIIIIMMMMMVADLATYHRPYFKVIRSDHVYFDLVV